ncbi:MAG: hypothetical protein WC138_13685 [Methanoculleus sp.]
MSGDLTSLVVPISIKWVETEGEWTAEAKSLDIRVRGLTQEIALRRIEDRIRDEFCDGFGAAADLTVESQVLSAKAEVSVWRYHQVDRSIFEFAAKETEKEMQRQGYDCSIEVEPHGGDAV